MSNVRRGIYIIFFPQLFTALAFALCIVTFFSSYKSAGGLKNVNFMTLDFSGITINGYDLSSLSALTSVVDGLNTYYGVGMNGWCRGTSTGHMSECYTPVEPFYFNLNTIFSEYGLTDLESYLPSEILGYNDLARRLTMGAWGCYLAGIVLIFFQFVVGFWSISSSLGACFMSLFSVFSTLATAIGGAMATAVFYAFKSKINQETSSLGIKASLGVSGMGVMWATVASLLVADVLSIFTCCFTRKKTRYVTLQEKEPHYFTEPV